MSKHYRKAYCKSLFPREHVLEMRRETYGISREEANYKSSRDVIEEMQLAMCSLSAIFDKTHPDNKLYDQIKLNINHYELWNKLENDLYELIGSVHKFNLEPMSLSCPTCGAESSCDD